MRLNLKKVKKYFDHPSTYATKKETERKTHEKYQTEGSCYPYSMQWKEDQQVEPNYIPKTQQIKTNLEFSFELFSYLKWS